MVPDGVTTPPPAEREVDQSHLANEHHHSIVAAFSVRARE